MGEEEGAHSFSKVNFYVRAMWYTTTPLEGGGDCKGARRQQGQIEEEKYELKCTHTREGGVVRED